MAQTIINNTINVKANDGDNGYYFRMEVIVNSYDSASNYWNVTVNHYAYGVNSQHYSEYSSPNSLIKTTIDGVTTTQQTTQVKRIDLNTERKIGTWTGNIYANADGNKQVTFIAKYAPNNSTSYLPKTNTNSVTVNMPTIPRYATITSFAVEKVDETTVNISWSANASCDAVQYSINNGASWAYGSGTNFNVGGLSAGTAYNFKIQVRRQDSGLWTPSGTYTQSTYSYPYITNAPDSNFTIEGDGIVSLYNPLSRNCTIYLLNSLDEQKELTTTTGGGIIHIPQEQQWYDFFYRGIPNSASGTYKVRVVCSAVSRDTTVNCGTCSVNPDINKPDISNFDASYVADLTNLTNNNQTVIDGASTITYTITDEAEALNYASIAKYTVTWGDAEPDIITDISDPATLVKGTGNTISVTVEDSRGVTNTVSTEISEVISYTTPTDLSVSLDREDGVGENVYLDIDGTIYYDKFGTNGVSNGITSITYTVVNGTAEDAPVSLSSLSYDSQSLDTHTQKFSIVNAPITEDGIVGGEGFDTTKTYEVIITVTDTTGNTDTIKGTIKDGRFAMIKGTNTNGDYVIGINGLPDNNYPLTVHGNIKADNVYNPYPIGAIYMSVDSTNPSTLFGGTWEQIQNTFLLACGSNYNAGSTGGAASVTLTANQSGLREHNHGAGGSYSGSNFYIRHGNTAGRDVVAGGANTSVDVGVGASWSNGIDMTSYTHNIDRVNIGGTVGVSVYNQGPWNAAEAHENMPPYLAVYMWKRTA